MANTYTLLETITVGAAGASSVTFNSIPQTGYTDLVVKMSVRDNTGNIGNFLNISLNGSTTSFTGRYLNGNGASASSGSGFPRLVIEYSGASSTANTFGNGEMYFPNYTSANYKSYSGDSVSENNATTAYADMSAGLWSSTAAITSITFTPNTGQLVQYSTFSLYGVSALGVTPTKAPKATGGSIIQTDGTYWYHAFLATGEFKPATALTCDVLVVAGGGGGGGYNNAGGGGAGGVLAFASQSIGTSGQTVTIGAGGAGSGSVTGASGSNSSFAALTAAVGGGGGGAGAIAGSGMTAPTTGGSGGGGGFDAFYPGAAGTSGQGFAGGTGSPTASNYPAGGGGGAGGVGSTSAGGVGTTSVTNWGALSTALSTTGLGVSSYLAGGGGGGANTTGGTGGTGGGGRGGNGGLGVAATANTGGGGGGGGGAAAGAAGGSGLVIIRYLAA
jgi:hypothetical protein